MSKLTKTKLLYKKLRKGRRVYIIQYDYVEESEVFNKVTVRKKEYTIGKTIQFTDNKNNIWWCDNAFYEIKLNKKEALAHYVSRLKRSKYKLNSEKRDCDNKIDKINKKISKVNK